MIENNKQRQAALNWITYLKGSVSAGDQSWLAGEQNLEEIMRLRHRIDAYDEREAAAIVIAR